MDLPYLIQVQICIALFWTVYRLFMRNSRAFGHNRAYLLGMIAVSFLLPALSIPVWPAPAPVGSVEVGELDLWYLQAMLLLEQPAEASFGWSGILLSIAGLGIGVLSAGVTRHTVRMIRSVRRSRITRIEKARLVCDENIHAPYSFFNYIFVNDRQTGREELSHIVAHEMAHIRLRHSYDAVFIQALLILFWWNPFIWLWSRSLKEVHEFQADEAVLHQGFDSKRYITLLIGTLADIHPEFVSGFSYSLIKNRLLMMTRQAGRFSNLRVLAAIPVIAASLLLFSFTEKKPGTLQTDPSHTDPTVLENTVGNIRCKAYTMLPDEKGSIYHMENTTLYLGDKLSDIQGFSISEIERSGILSLENFTFRLGENEVWIKEGVIRNTEEGFIIEAAEATLTLPSGSQQTLQVTAPPPTDTNEPFVTVEEMPVFQGGDVSDFRNWVQGKIRHPSEMAEQKMEGRVTVSFIIEKDGTLSNIDALHGPTRAFINEALRVVADSPKWTPGKQRGQAVRVRMTLPVDFRLNPATSSPSPAGVNEEPFVAVENMPKFQGGDRTEFRNWVMKEVVYPQEAARQNIQGRVYVEFIVEKNGAVSHVEAIEGSEPLLKEAAVRAVAASPAWTPGTQRGREVRVKFTIPVDFKLSGGNSGIPSVQGESPADITVIGYAGNSNPDFADLPPVLVNGVPYTGTLDRLIPDKIQSIDVTMDADRTRYPDGVIKVTLKEGETVATATKPESPENRSAIKIAERTTSQGSGISIHGYSGDTPTGQPLFILDGVKKPEFNFNSIDSDNIESISVLKDASAVQQYGEEGKNGVVIITSKKSAN